MPKLTAHAKIFRDWEALIGACDKSSSLLAGSEPLQTELGALLAQGREIKLQQENLDGSRKAVTQNLVELEDRGKEVARKLRAFVLSRIGTKTELGKMFGLVPTGRKVRKAKTPVAAKPPTTPPASHASPAAEKAAPASNSPVQSQGGTA